MSDGFIRQVGTKRFDLGGASRKKEIFLAIALGLIIVASLTITIAHFFGGGGPGRATPQNPRFQCDKCKYEFEIKPDELGPEQLSRMDAIPGDCPQCKAKNSCYPMTKCPKCGFFFVSDQTKIRMYSQWKGKVPPDNLAEMKEICPQCQTDVAAYYREQAEKRH